MYKKIFTVILSIIAIIIVVITIRKFPNVISQNKQSDANKKIVVIKVDGSSTVYPITEAVAEEFQKKNPNTKVTVGIAGTGGGFKKFCNGEIDISDASRPIKSKEAEACLAKGIEYIELPIAFDGLSVVVNPENNWVKEVTVTELKKIWEPEAQKKITRWNQIRPSFPNEEIRLFGPGVDSGTFDYFTAAIVGKEGKSRGDYTASEDDNVLVQGISTDKFALGYLGVSYYQQNKDKLKLIAVDDEDDTNGKGPVLPEYDNVVNGTYQPLARPIFIYVSIKALEKTEVKNFVEYYLRDGDILSKEVGYIAFSDEVMSLVKKRFADKKIGSVYGSGTKGSIKELLEKN